MDRLPINSYVKKNHKLKKTIINELTSNPSLSASSQTNDRSKKDIDGIVNSVLLKYMTDHLSAEKALNKEYKADLKALVPILSEYLENYILIGHDLLGNEVMYFAAKNQNDRNAVTKLFADTFIKIMSSPNSGGGGGNLPPNI